MTAQEQTLLEKVQEKVAALTAELDQAIAKWVIAERELRIEELQAALTVAEKTRDLERIEAIKTKLAVERAELPPDEETVRREGEVVTNIPWETGVDVSWAHVWSLCDPHWVQMKVSHYELDRVCGLVAWNWIQIHKCYGGDFQLMRYEGRLFWVRKGARG
ncbi:MAG: hypothetical protein N2V78_03890 [Methanophagales archaeon]|nr:hypothetical protein [Methanophagales archaeon]